MPGASPRNDVDDSNAEDLRLVRAIQAGEAGAWAALVGRHQDRLYNVCLRMIGDREAAADLTQDAMVRIIQGLASYDGRARLSTWLIRVTMNVCLSHIRSQKLRRHASLDGMGGAEAGGGGRADKRRVAGAGGGRNPPPPHAPPSGRGTVGELSPGEAVQREEEHATVAAALASLEPEQRSILVLRDVQGLDYEQIAEALEVAVGTVKSRLFRARVALREAVEGKG